MLRSRGLYLILAAVLLVAVAFFFDAAVQNWMTHHQTRSGKIFMREASRWGDWPTHLVIGIIGATVCWIRNKRVWLKIFIAMILALSLTGIVNPVIKAAAGRARPSVKEHTGWIGPNLHQKYHAFPSGHTIATSAFFTALLLERRRIGLALLPIPVTIAASRLYLNAHHLSDVVCGAVLGVCCALIAWRLIARWEKSHPVEVIPASRAA